MADFKASKVVSNLPEQLEPDTVYFVRKGQGFDIHCTNGVGDIVAYALNPIEPNKLQKTHAQNGDSEEFGAVSGELLWEGADSWYHNAVEHVGTSGGGFTGKTSTVQLTTPPSGSGEQVVSSKAQTEFSGTSTVGGWVGGIDAVVQVHPNSTADKTYGSASYFQFGAGTATSKVLGFEFVINHVDRTADIGDVVGFYVANLSGVPNINRIRNFHCFASDMPGADMRIQGAYRRIDRGDYPRELVPSVSGVQGTSRQWCVGRLIENGFGQQELPAGTACVGAIYLSRRTRIKEMGVVLTVGAPGNGRLCIYEQGPSGYLGRKIWQSETISTNTGGNKTTAVNQELDSGLYLVTFNASTTVGIRVVSNAKTCDIFGTPGVDTLESLPFYSVGGFPSQMPGDLRATDPTGFLGGIMPDFNYTVDPVG